MMPLVEFLNARPDEDEASVLSGECLCSDGPKRPDCGDRVLRDVAAKRMLIFLFEEIVKADQRIADRDQRDTGATIMVGYLSALLVVAKVYADHPDYREDWALTMSPSPQDAVTDR